MQRELRSARCNETLADVGPIPNIPYGFEEFCRAVLVLEVIRVFPSIDHQERNAGLREVGLMIVDLCHEKARGERFLYQPLPNLTP